MGAPVSWTDSTRPQIVVAAGPRAAEEVVFDWLDARLDGDDRLALLGEPVRVIVPSRSLRLHLSAEIVRRRGAVAGVVVQTLHSLAAEVVERAGDPLARHREGGDALLEVLVRRFGRELPALAEGLEELADGYGTVAATVRDFLDAGLEPELADAVADAAASGGRADETGRTIGTRAERERAEAIVRLADAVDRGLRAMELRRASTLLRRAAELLATGTGPPPTRAVMIHGFADATGVAAELLETLLRGGLGGESATLLLDRPPVPTGASASDPQAREEAFSRRFLERLSGVAEAVDAPPDTAPSHPAQLRTLAAPGADGEIREVARRIRALLDSSAVPPERIGVVVRTLSPEQPYGPAIRRHFERLGIPFSSVGSAGPLRPPGRRLRALLEILRRREMVTTDRWLDALTAPVGTSDISPEASAPQRHRPLELRLALHTLGAARLRDVATLDSERFAEGSFPLPIRTGLGPGAGPGATNDGTRDDDGAGAYDAPDRPLRRRIPAWVIRRAIEDARRLVRRLGDWPTPAPFSRHLERLRTLLREDLHWHTPALDDSSEPEPDPREHPVAAALTTLEGRVPGVLELDDGEVVLLLDRELRDAGRDPLGGDGGGVTVLDAVEARSRTFGHLFVVGLNRGLFPRPIQEDPLLADDLRGALLGVLPDLPLKRRGFAEERHLFAQLVAAAPEVTLSWQSATASGDPTPRSPLLDRIEGLPAPGADSDEATSSDPNGPRPAAEHVIAAGLFDDREAFSALLPIALEEAWSEESPADGDHPGGPFGLDPAAVAAAHRAILDEMDPDLSTPEGRARRRSLGPYFGFVGPATAGDPRGSDLWVTTLEGMTGCPWQTFLQRLLRVEPTPDPLQAVPGLSPLLVGSLVHAVLEGIVTRALPEPHARDLDEADAPDARDPVEVPWPEPAEVEAIFRERAARLLADEGIALPGLERALAAAARPFVEAAREAEWSSRPPAVLAAEVTGSIPVPDAAGGERPLHFRADRVDRMVDRRFPGLRLTDYKTGRPISEAVRQKTRDEHFLHEVEAGKRLQAVAYALATGGPLPSMHAGQGRYVFVRPGLPPEQREFGVWGSHVPFVEAFEAAVRAALAAWDRGAFFPRLVEPDRDLEPRRCSWCPVHEACVRGDSGARRRLAAWTQSRRQGSLTEAPDAGETAPDAPHRAERALLDVWTLPSRTERGARAGRSGEEGR